MKSLILALALTALVSGCALTCKTPAGEPMTAADDFECDHTCGVDDLKVSVVQAGMCQTRCRRAKGYICE
jgi:hypothetical protein